MTSLEHEALVELFAREPRSALALLAGKVALPDHEALEVQPADQRELVPTTLRVDVVVLLRKGEPVFALLVEVQLSRDDEKRLTWPHYVTSARLRYRCPTCLLVFTTHDEIRRWAQSPIDLGQPGSSFVPLVVSARDVPRIEDPAVAEQVPYAALLSAVAHAQADGNESIFEAVWAALQKLPPDERATWLDILMDATNTVAKRLLEAKMLNLEPFKRQLPSFKEGRAEGLAEAKREDIKGLCHVLEARLSRPRLARLEAMTLPELESLWAHLVKHRSWPVARRPRRG